VRRIVVAMLVVAFAPGCSGKGAATIPTVTVASSTTTTVAVTTTTRAATTTTVATTSTMVAGAPEVDMVPAGYDLEDFVPLVENYFAVRNWALEHPDEVTEEILATVIEPGSAEMQTTMAEIQDLVDQDAHYEGLSETFELVEADFVKATTDPESGKVSVSLTVEYGDTELVSSEGTSLSTDTLRRAPWTLDFNESGEASWLVYDVFRNPFDHAPGTP